MILFHKTFIRTYNITLCHGKTSTSLFIHGACMVACDDSITGCISVSHSVFHGQALDSPRPWLSPSKMPIFFRSISFAKFVFWFIILLEGKFLHNTLLSNKDLQVYFCAKIEGICICLSWAPVPAEEKQPHCMILPPPCFTMSMVSFG